MEREPVWHKHSLLPNTVRIVRQGAGCQPLALQNRFLRRRRGTYDIRTFDGLADGGCYLDPDACSRSPSAAKALALSGERPQTGMRRRDLTSAIACRCSAACLPVPRMARSDASSYGDDLRPQRARLIQISRHATKRITCLGQEDDRAQGQEPAAALASASTPPVEAPITMMSWFDPLSFGAAAC